MGNICRSPIAAAVLQRLVAEAGLEGEIQVVSAGTGGWHVGEAADPRAQAVLRRGGYPPEHRARQFRGEDFATCDLVIALDAGNERDLRRLARTDADRAKIRVLRSFDPDAVGDLDVPDPYYSDDAAFDHVLALIEAAAPGVLAAVRPRR
jgi:protein-tyrosine phosphatase